MTKARDLADFLGSGADIAGTITADALTSSGNLTFDAVAINTISSNGFLYYNVPTGYTHTFQYNGTNVLNMNGPDIYFYEDTGTTPKMVWKSADERLGIGTSSPAAKLDVATTTQFTFSAASTAGVKIGTQGTAGGSFMVQTPSLSDTFGSGLAIDGSYSGGKSTINLKAFGVYSGGPYSSDLAFYTSTNTTLSEKMRLDNSGNLGVGTASPVSIGGYTITTLNNSGSGSALYLQQAGATKGRVITTANELTVDTTAAIPLVFGTNSAERMRIDSSGNLLVGRTSSSGVDTDGHVLWGSGISYQSTTSNSAQFINRNGTDGEVIKFYKGGVAVGSIATYAGDLIIGDDDIAIRFDTGAGLIPWDIGATATGGSARDAAIDIGASSARFKDLYLSGGVRNVNSDGINFGTSGGEPNIIPVNGGTQVDGQGSIGTSANRWKDLYLSGKAQADTYQFAQNSGAVGASEAIYRATTGTIAIKTNSSERMRIDASGNLLVGTTSARTGTYSLTLEAANSYFQMRAGGTGSLSQIAFVRDTAGTPVQVGSIDTTGTATSYNTSSDYRLKEDVQPMVGASDRVLSLNPVNFAWKVDGSRTDGFIAHEVQEVAPYAVTGEKDGEDMQGMDHSKLVPLLTAALQEALTEIANLKARVAALEA